MAPDVPLLIPEINPDHTDLIPAQRAGRDWSGFIVASPNCSTTSAVLPMKVLQDAFGLEAAIMTTMQAISGAGYPGIPGSRHRPPRLGRFPASSRAPPEAW